MRPVTSSHPPDTCPKETELRAPGEHREGPGRRMDNWWSKAGCSAKRPHTVRVYRQYLCLWKPLECQFLKVRSRVSERKPPVQAPEIKTSWPLRGYSAKACAMRCSQRPLLEVLEVSHPLEEWAGGGGLCGPASFYCCFPRNCQRQCLMKA